MRKKIRFLLTSLMLCNFFVYSNDYSLFFRNGKYGIIDNKRNIVEQAEFDWVSISSKYIECSKNKSIEIYNKDLKLIYSPDSLTKTSLYDEENFLITEFGGKKNYLLNLTTGKLSNFYQINFDIPYGYRNGLALKIEDDASYSIVDKKGNVILTDINQAHSVYTNGMIAVILKNGKSGFVNEKGNFVIETDFYIDPDDLNAPRKIPAISYFFNENYALVKNENKKWIQFDLKGNKKEIPQDIVPISLSYKKGLTVVKDVETKKMGFMNPKFKLVIPCIFEEVHQFEGNYAIVVYENKDAIVDANGNIFFCEELK